MPNPWDALAPIFGIIGLVLAALIAGGFSLLNIVLSKEKAVSRFRQTWIDDLRSEIASLVARTLQITSHPIALSWKSISDDAGPKGTPENYKAFYAETRVDSIKLNQSMTRIKLRLNPNDPEPESGRVLSLLDDLDKALMNVGSQDFLQRTKAITDAIELAAQPLLKKEWERVKKGEKVYQNAKKFAARSSLSLAAFLLLLVFAFGGFLLGSTNISKEQHQPCIRWRHTSEFR